MTKKYIKYSIEPNFTGYPLFYIINNEEVWCSGCCNDNLVGDEAVIQDANWENPELYCCNCSSKINSAYGNDEMHEICENEKV